MQNNKNKNNDEIYFGSRGEDFVKMLTTFIKKGKLEPDFEEYLIKKIKFFDIAFTASSANQVENYEVLEQKGDASAGKFLIDYFYKRFPQLNCPEGVKICARLKINYGSKNSFHKIADDNNMWKFISARMSDRNSNKKALCEDVFEAVLGQIENIINKAWGIETGYGYSCVYNILEKIFDEKPISLKYEELYDAKTRLKELVDSYKSILNNLNYNQVENQVTVSLNITHETKNKSITTKKTLGVASAPLKIDAEQLASAISLDMLKSMGFSKKVPEIYQTFQDNVKKPITIDDIKKQYPDINMKIRYEKKSDVEYFQTPLLYFCSIRDLESVKNCIKLGADVNAVDSSKMNCEEKTVIGSVNSGPVGNILVILSKHKKLSMRQDIYKTYFSQYLDPTIVKNANNLDNFQRLAKKITQN